MPAFTGTNDSDLLSGTGGADAMRGLGSRDEIHGLAGNDKLWGGGGDDELWGEGGNDLLYGQSGGDVLLGLDANDVLDGGAGDDLLLGGAGHDTYRFAANWGADIIAENAGEGFDVIRFDASVALSQLTFTVEDYSLVIRGPGGSITLDGQYLHGFEDYGSPGHVERLIMADGTTVDLTDPAAFIRPVVGNNGSQQLQGTFIGETIDGKAGHDVILAGAGADTVIGGLGNDRLFGDAGDDVIFGDAGADYLAGEAGSDVLTGGLGADVFDVSLAWTGSSTETILDFEDGKDKLYLWGYSAGSGLDIDEPAEVLARAAQIGADTVITLPHNSYSTSTTTITLAGFALANLDGGDLILHYLG